VELDVGVHEDGDGLMMDQVLQHGKKKKVKNKNPKEMKAKVLIGILFFSNQNTIEDVIGFRIDNRTINRGNLEVIVVI
jgi:hypothetical protein